MNGMAPRRSPTNSESAQLTRRLLACLPAATFEMETLCRLAGIKANRDVPTAAVECLHRPHLLLNPDFVAKYCARDEHLFLLVMHELWHIILAHTRLYPRVTPAHNIAFDAIINAGLARLFPYPEYRGFFESINPAGQFPGMLLRPPDGWPLDPDYSPADAAPQGTRAILERLYPPGGVSLGADPLYEEILNLLRSAGYGTGETVVYVEPVLLGDHDNAEAEARVLDDPLFGDLMRGMIRRWPEEMPIVIGRGDGRELQSIESKMGDATEATRRTFAGALRRCLGPQRGREQRKARSPVPGMGGMGVVPNARDRLVPARRNLGVQGMLWRQSEPVRARVPETPSRAYIYLDVSGSMSSLLPHLLGLILPYVSDHRAEVFQFSNYVAPMPLAELRGARLRSSFGTDINCVLVHALEAKPTLRRVLILTDGYTGVPRPDLAQGITEQNLHICAVLPAENATTDQLQGLARRIVVLPPVRGGGSPWRVGQR
jgi:hypothetical protein